MVGARRRRGIAWLVVGVLAAFGAFGAPSALAAQTIDVSVTQVTGTAPFNATAGPGKDVDAANDIVRSNDTVTYQVQFNVNDTDAGSSTASNVTIEQALPGGLKWTRLPATCRTTGVTPPSEISVDGKTITCNVGDVETGKSQTIALSANVTETTDGAVLTAPPGAVQVDADGATGASTTPDPVTVSSIPRVDMVKSAPNVSETTYNGVAGFFLKYPVRVMVPDFGGRGQIGYEPPAAAMKLFEDFSGVSPNAEFVSCGGDSRGSWSCPAAGTASPLPIDVTVTDPTTTDGNGWLSSTTVTIFVPKQDVVDAGSNGLRTDNVIAPPDPTDASKPAPDGDPDANAAVDGNGTSAVGEIWTNNDVQATISLSAGSGFNIYKHYIDVTAPGRYVPGGANLDRNGFSTVGPGQIFQGEVRTSASNPAAGYSAVTTCDIFDRTTQQVTLKGAASNPAYGNDSPAWITTNSVTGGASLVQGTDFVLEYSTAATSIDADDATRWSALSQTGCDSGTWTATPPTTEGAANGITGVRLRFLTPPPRQYTLSFAVNFEAKPGVEATKIANFATYHVDGSPVTPSTYNPATHTGSRGDRLILTAAQLTLAKDILDPVTPPTGSPAVRGGEDVQFGLRPLVKAPAQTTAPGVVTARDVTVTDILPAGTTLSKLPGHEASPTPTSVTPNPDGTTTLTWDLGTQTSNDAPSITYWATISNTATGSKVNRAMVTSPDDAGSPASVPTGGSDPHYAARTVTVDSLGGIQVDKAIDKQVIEPRDALTFTVTYANLDLAARNDMDTIDVLPFNGDGTAAGTVPGRQPGSDFHGTFVLRDVTVHDNEVVRYTDADPAAVYALYDPSAASPGFDALPAGKAWCTATQITAADAGCPTSIGTATALRVTRTGPLGAGENRAFSYTIDTTGNRSGDVYANTAALRSSTLSLGTLSPTRDAHVVANRIGDYVWNDLNEDGLQDADEPGVSGVGVTLDGVDKHGRTIHVTTTTGPDGKYLFTSGDQSDQDAGVLDLVSGTYHVTFDPKTLPERASFTIENAGSDDAEDSDANVTTGRTADVVLPDPTPDDADGENLTLDAGIVIAPAPLDPTPPVPPAPPAPPIPPALPAPPVAPPLLPKPPVLAPRLRLRKTANHTRVKPGRTIRYRLTARNTGKGTAKHVRLCDTLPRHVTLVTSRKRLAKVHAKLVRGKLCWTIGTLKAGKHVTRSVTVRVDRDARGGRIVNRATLDRTNVKGTDAKARRTVRVQRVKQRTTTSRVTG